MANGGLAVRGSAHTRGIAGWQPTLRITERDGRVQLGIEGLSNVEGATLQDTGDQLDAQLLDAAMALRADGCPLRCSELRPDPRARRG